MTGTRFDSEVYKVFAEKVKQRIGEGRFAEAQRKRSIMEHPHIIKTLHTLGYLSYRESFEILRDILKDRNDVEVSPDGTASDLIIRDGKVWKEDRPVLPVFFPLLLNGDSVRQYLITFDEYEILERRLSALSASGESVDLEYTPKDLIREAIEKEASDFHLIPKFENYHVFFRIHGEFVEQKHLIMNKTMGMRFIDVLMVEASAHTKGSFSADERKVYQDARLVYDDLNCEVRLAYIPDGRTMHHGEVVGRIIVRKKIKADPDVGKLLVNLGYYPEHAEVWEYVRRKKGVLVVVSGPTNSGKSTLIVHVIAGITDRKVVTVEDPVEYETEASNIMHHQIYEPKDESLRMGFVEYVRGFKRGDTDVIFIGELREGSTGLMESVMSAAYAGQLIFTTVHISSAFEIYSFLSSRFAVGHLTRDQVLSFALDKIFLVHNQILAPRLCPFCKEEVRLEVSDEELAYTNLDEFEKSELLRKASEGVKVYRKGDGCEKCRGQGYVDRIPIYEFFIPNQELKDKIAGGDMPPHAIKDYVVKNRSRIKSVTKFEIFMRRLLEGEIEKDVLYLI